jgi:hypothetical protein
MIFSKAFAWHSAAVNICVPSFVLSEVTGESRTSMVKTDHWPSQSLFRVLSAAVAENHRGGSKRCWRPYSAGKADRWPPFVPARLIAERWLPNTWINCPNPERPFPHLMGRCGPRAKNRGDTKRVFERSSPSTHSLRSSYAGHAPPRRSPPGCATRSPSGRSVVGEEGLEPSKS